MRQHVNAAIFKEETIHDGWRGSELGGQLPGKLPSSEHLIARSPGATARSGCKGHHGAVFELYWC